MPPVQPKITRLPDLGKVVKYTLRDRVSSPCLLIGIEHTSCQNHVASQQRELCCIVHCSISLLLMSPLWRLCVLCDAINAESGCVKRAVAAGCKGECLGEGAGP